MSSFGAALPRHHPRWRTMLALGAGFSLAAVASFFLAYHPVSVLLVIAAVIISAGILCEPFVGVPVIFLLGMIGDLQHFAMGLSVAKVVMALMVLGFIARLATRRTSLRRTGLGLAVVAFFLVYCGGMGREINSSDDLSSLLTNLGYPVAFFMVLNLVRSRLQIEWVVGSVAAGALLAALASIVERSTGYSPLVALGGLQAPIESTVVSYDWQRSLGLMRDPNASAYPHLLAVPLLIAATLATRKQWLRVVLLTVTAVSAVGLAMTFSRSAYIGLLASLVCLVLNLRSRRALGVVVIACILVVVVVGTVPLEVLTARFEHLGQEIGTQADRWIYYRTGLRLWWENPWFGAGDRAFMLEIAQQVGVAQGPHSNVLAVATNAGLIGLAVMLWMVVRYARFVHRGFGSMAVSPLRYYALGSYAGLVGFLVQGLFIANMGWFLMWAIAAVPLCCAMGQRSSDFGCSQPLRGGSVPHGH